MVAEQLGKTVAPGPLYPVSTVLAGLVDCADPQAHAATIEALMSGETRRVVGGLRTGPRLGAA